MVVIVLLAMGIEAVLQCAAERLPPAGVAEKDRGEIIATMNFLSFCGVALSSVVLYLLDLVKVDAATRFFLLGVSRWFSTAYVIYILPRLSRPVYRTGHHAVRLPPGSDRRGETFRLRGARCLVANHVSYADAVLLMAAQQRRVRFVMSHEIYNSRRFNWLFRLLGAIPVSNRDSPKEIIRALQQVRKAIDEGWLVCIFAEGSLTRTGYIMEFKRGFEHIMRGSKHPIIPVNIHGIWGSVFSYAHGRILGRIPSGRGRRVIISFGDPMPPGTTAFPRAASRDGNGNRAPFSRIGISPCLWSS